LRDYIREIEKSCAENPESADLRTCLGMAHAMNFDVYKSMDALEEAVRIDSGNFFAQLKYAELFYRIRGLPQAERETLKALELANNSWEMALARKQLQVVRELRRNGTQKPEWTGSLIRPALALLALFVVLSALMVWKS
ncbi:MAG: tetratricopeptide repeat protein, partial [Bryobacteraceae bacterium]